MATINICRLCLCECQQAIELFNEKGRQLQIVQYITKHFWFEPSEYDPYSKYICTVCWKNLKDFHNFYETVKTAHEEALKQLNNKTSTNSIDQNESNPSFCENVSIKDEIDDENSSNGSRFDNKICTDQVEIKINADLIKIENCSARTLRKRRRSKNHEIEVKNIQKPKTSKKSMVENNPTKIDEENEQNKEIADQKQNEDDQKIRDFYELKCEKCEFQSDKFLAIKQHYLKIHSIKKGFIRCCGTKHISRTCLLDHIQWHSDPESFRCPICFKCSQGSHGLKSHMKRHSTPIYECDMCGKKYTNKIDLGKHIKHKHILANSIEYDCSTCGKRFKTEYFLKTHISNVHNLANACVCDICAKVFKSKHQCLVHRKLVHLNQEKVQCEFCNMWYKSEKSLLGHIKQIHHENKPVICHICGKEKPNRAALRKHIRYVHEIERLHKCNYCEKAFKFPTELKEHVTLHTGAALYVCSFCSKTFNSNSNRYTHQKKLHPIEWQEERKNGLKK